MHIDAILALAHRSTMVLLSLCIPWVWGGWKKRRVFQDAQKLHLQIRRDRMAMETLESNFMDITSAASVLTCWDIVIIVIGLICTIGCSVYMTTDVWDYMIEV